MNEKELAAELQRTKDDGTEWGDGVSGGSDAKSTKRRLAAMVSVRLSAEELERVQHRAVDCGQTVSAYLRGLAIRDVEANVVPEPYRWGAVTVSSPGTYLTHLENPGVTVDGRYLHTCAG